MNYKERCEHLRAESLNKDGLTPYKRKMAQSVALAIWMLSGSNNVNDIIIDKDDIVDQLDPFVTEKDIENYINKLIKEAIDDASKYHVEQDIDNITKMITESITNTVTPLVNTCGLSLGRRLRNYSSIIDKKVIETIRYRIDHFDDSVIKLITNEAKRQGITDDKIDSVLIEQLPLTMLMSHDEAQSFINRMVDSDEAILDLSTSSPYVPKETDIVEKVICGLPTVSRIMTASAKIVCPKLGQGVIRTYSSDKDLGLIQRAVIVVVLFLMYYAVKKKPNTNLTKVLFTHSCLHGEWAISYSAVIKENKIIFIIGSNPDKLSNHTLLEFTMPETLAELYTPDQ